MREYKYRGKRIDNGEWVYGYYAVGKYEINEVHMIYVNCTDKITGFKILYNIAVHPESVGQFTELTDRTEWEDATEEQRREYTEETWNGVEIYEGDILKHSGFGKPNLKVISYVRNGYEPSSVYKDWEKGILAYKVVGNTTDNLELLEVK